jgi:hypothetical protein
MNTPDRLDVEVEDHGSILLFDPLTPVASDWILENVDPAALRFGRRLAVEHRYAGALMVGMAADGLRVGGAS